MANSSIDLIALDPDTFKASLIAFMQSDPLFKDYDFAGSNLNLLMSLLSRNTFQNAFYLNMVNAESWLDSAQDRSSVVSRAKELNYTPRSARSASTVVSITFNTDGLNVVVIPKGTTFSGRTGIDSFNFAVAETKIFTSTNGSFTIDGLEIFEGNYIADSFLMDYNQESQRFVLSNKNIDTTSISVSVTEDNSDTSTTYLQKTTLLDVSAQDPVFFLQANDREKYEIVFGDGIIGRRPKNGAVITVEYRVCNGEAANGVREFTLNRDITDGHLAGPVVTSAIAAATGGSAAETLESIRFMAPRHFQTQERAVTTSDYEILLSEQFPEINAVAVFGGEEMDPPQYGSVFIAVDISNVTGLPDAKKQQYYAFLKPRSPMSIDPIFIDPGHIYYRLIGTVNYNINVTALRPEDIKTVVLSAIAQYDQNFLNDFKVTLRTSKMLSVIDNAHTSIVSNDTNIDVYKKITPTLGLTDNYIVSFAMPLYNKVAQVLPQHSQNELHAMTSSPFTVGGDTVTLEDDGQGVVRIVKTVRDQHVTLKSVGSIDYDTGIVRINGLKIDSFEGDSVRVYVLPRSKDIVISGNNILGLEVEELNLTINQVRE